MSLLQLKDIGKIYVSEGNVSVGIRGVNLSFEKGEFVAVTGASGSGKSTLLNVISGMDTYEEGELFIEDQPTSHFLQSDWEEYRQKYISFIFQEYNIIESYTVLQNVELALMHIENKRERRARAIELLNRVGMGSHLKHKGSKLSGGQKQRTVIARALAKDSPIILADEPTGNLDSETSKEIIALMREVAKDKLLIIVTHNFEQVEDYATRHIRVFDGAVESDRVLRPSETVAEEKATPSADAPTKARKKFADVKNGITLGSAIFKATPKLSFFMCVLMLLGTLGIFLATAFFGDFTEMFEPDLMFNDIEGRLVLVKRSGEVLTESELDRLKSELNAKSFIHYDFLLDQSVGSYSNIKIVAKDDNKKSRYITPNYIFGESITPDIGRQPEKINELLLSLPISYQSVFGKTELKNADVTVNGIDYTVVGVHYYADNNKTPKALLSEDGFKFMSVYSRAFGSGSSGYSDFYVRLEANADSGESLPLKDFYSGSIKVSFDESVVKSGKIAVCNSDYIDFRNNNTGHTVTPYLSLFYSYTSHGGYDISAQKSFQKVISNDDIEFKRESTLGSIIFSPEALTEIMEEYLGVSYTQASLFFESDARAEEVADQLNKSGYIAVPANTTYEADPLNALVGTLGCVLNLVIWVFAILFLAFFINLCSQRTLGAFKGDMAIMRSMGITVSVIKAGMYVRMLISLIPAFILLVLCPIFIYTSPTLNSYFTYLYGYQYALIVVGMLILTLRVTHRQVKKLFNESVKKSLKGGHAE